MTFGSSRSSAAHGPQMCGQHFPSNGGCAGNELRANASSHPSSVTGTSTVAWCGSVPDRSVTL